MELTAYLIDGANVDIRPAPIERPWMDATRGRFAYNCAPMVAANTHGWEILAPAGFSAGWNGAAEPGGLWIKADPGEQPNAFSHFGHGVLTLTVDCLFRAEAGHDLLVQGPINMPKDGIAPLSGIVEVDRSVRTFTMNWKFTRPGVIIKFAKGEPYCHISVMKRGEMAQIQPAKRPLEENRLLQRKFEVWRFTHAASKGSDPQSQKDGPDAATLAERRTLLKPFA